MGLYNIIQKIERRRKILDDIKQDLLKTKSHLSKTILEVEDADEIILSINSISNAIKTIDELSKEVL